jgi:hypothetical protein
VFLLQAKHFKNLNILVKDRLNACLLYLKLSQNYHCQPISSILVKIKADRAFKAAPKKFKIYDFSYFSRVLEFYYVRNIKIRKLPEKAIQR